MPECPTVTRAKLAERLHKEGRPELAAKLERCAETMRMQCVCCADSMIVEKGCARRWCPVCAPRITAKRLERMARIVCRFQWPLATTLTIRNTADAEGSIEQLKQSFRKFRRTDFWSRNSRGGVFSYEMTHRGRGFHPHIHVLHDCEWMAIETPRPRRGMSKKQVESLCTRAQNELSEVWGAYVQGEKASVWNQRAWGKALEETLKYAVKPSDLLKVKCRASDMIDEMDRGRLIGTFGHAHAASKNFVGLEEVVMKEHACKECKAKKSIVPEDVLVKMLNNPAKLSEKWKAHVVARLQRFGVDAVEILRCIDDPEQMRRDGWTGGQYWNDDEE